MLKGRTVAVIGGSSGIGFRVAQLAIAAGANAVVGARSQPLLSAAAAELGDKARAIIIDNRDQDSIRRFFQSMDRLDHLFTPGATYSRGPINQISDEEAESPFKSKFWGQYWSVKHALPLLSKDGSITLMSGVWSVRPPPGAAAYSACNAAIEGLGRALAVELSPIRVNVVSPGTADTDLWRNVPEDRRIKSFEDFSRSVPLGRVGTADEVARAVLFLMTATFTTGSTMYVDGGFTLR
jgi:NAD(P)-dependent dehydrogenase (short-subunit alcohol dehydrogenase family)